MAFVSYLLIAPARLFNAKLSPLHSLSGDFIKMHNCENLPSLHEIQEIYVFVVFFHTNLEKA